MSGKTSGKGLTQMYVLDTQKQLLVDDCKSCANCSALSKALEVCKGELHSAQAKLAQANKAFENESVLRDELQKQVNKLSDTVCKMRSIKKANAKTQTMASDWVTDIVSRVNTTVEETSSDAVHDKSEVDWMKGSDTGKSIADMVKEAAETAVQQTTGFVYDESSKMYYDHSTGYYYNAENSLYYDPKTGIYFYYNQEKGEYTFHSQVDLASQQQKVAEDLWKKQLKDENERNRRRNAKKRKKAAKKNNSRDESHDASDEETDERRKRQKDWRKVDPLKELKRMEKGGDMEDGELSESEQSEDTCGSSVSEEWFSDQDERFGEYSPGCLRAVVISTESDEVVFGSLYVVTAHGGSVGRLSRCDVHIQDNTVMEEHALIEYRESESAYFMRAVDEAVVVLNGETLNTSQDTVDSDGDTWRQVRHGDRLQVGTTHLLLHVHLGTDTCARCEPGEVQAVGAAHTAAMSGTETYSVGGEAGRRRGVKELKKKYGINKEQYVESEASGTDGQYSDRAARRRRDVGSDSPHGTTRPAASVNRHIDSGNKGFKMLSKMGWKEGDSLGKANKGITEPIQVAVRGNQAGLGSTAAAVSSMDNVASVEKQKIIAKTKQRFDAIERSQKKHE